MRKNIAVNTLPTTAVVSTKKSLSDPRKTGGSTQPLDRAVAALLTRTESESSRNVVKTIAAVCLGLMDQTMSGDCIYLALTNAHRMAVEAGVPSQEAEAIVKALSKVWQARRNRNPISGMFE